MIKHHVLASGTVCRALVLLSAICFLPALAIAEETTPVTPTTRTITDSGGRKIEVTIIGTSATGIKAKRTSDGKDFTLELAKLSADDQAFVGALKPTLSENPETEKKTLRVLYAIPPDAALVGDYYNVKALIEMGYDVTLTAEVIPAGAWPVKALRGGRLAGDTTGDSCYTPTKKTLTTRTIAAKDIKPEGYDVLFLAMDQRRPGILPKVLRDWKLQFVKDNKPVTNRNRSFYKNQTNGAKSESNFVFERDGVIEYDDGLRSGHDPKQGDEDLRYDSDITKKLMRALKTRMEPKP